MPKQQNRDVDLDSTVLVPLDAIVREMGGSYEVVEYWTRTLKVEPVKDWRGLRALRANDARRVVEACRSSRDEHAAKWERYQAFLRDRKEAARLQREQDLAERRQAVERARTEGRRRAAERALRDAEAEAAVVAERAPAAVPTFEEFTKSKA